MTLEQLRIFVAVADRLHMTRAAEALNLTQSAASAGIAALEARHGIKLFDRVGRGLALSAAGEVFLPEARAVLASAEVATQALDDLAGLRRGALVLAASQTVASYWLPQRMAQFAARHRAISLTLTVGNTAQVARAVLEGAAELGFVEGRVEEPALARARVADDRLGLYAAPGHPLIGKAIHSGLLAVAAWVLREPGSGTRAQLEQALAEQGLAVGALNVVMELPSNEAVMAAVSGGGLVTGVSQMAAEPMVAAGRLAPLAFDVGTRQFSLVTHKERLRSRAAQAFVDEL